MKVIRPLNLFYSLKMTLRFIPRFYVTTCKYEVAWHIIFYSLPTFYAYIGFTDSTFLFIYGSINHHGGFSQQLFCYKHYTTGNIYYLSITKYEYY